MTHTCSLLQAYTRMHAVFVGHHKHTRTGGSAVAFRRVADVYATLGDVAARRAYNSGRDVDAVSRAEASAWHTEDHWPLAEEVLGVATGVIQLRT